jgi:hypothetical protein
MPHKIKSALAGVRLFSLAWSDTTAKAIMLVCTAVIFFLLGVGVSYLDVDDHARIFVRKVHKQPETVPTKSVVTIPIVPRIINANPVSQPALPGEQSSTRQSDQPASPPAVANAANPTGLADVPQSTPPARSEAEDRENVRCLAPKTRALLDTIEVQFGRVLVISTCRPGAVIASSGNPSRHRNGNAIDFVAPNGKKSAVVDWLVKNHKAGGVMTYSDSEHIHVDIGPHFVSLAGEKQKRRRYRDDDD